MSEEKAINKKDLNRGYVYFGNSTLEIGVQNLGQLNDLISNVELKQKELQEAVRELARFKLKINFQQTQLTHQPTNHTE